MSEASRVRVPGPNDRPVEVELSNLDKPLFPDVGFTKAEVIDYYTRVAPMLLPHLERRPLTRIRYPNGVAAGGFFEKNAPDGTPEWVSTVTLPAPHSARGRDEVRYLVIDNLAALVWSANQAAIELHVPQWRLEPQELEADARSGRGRTPHGRTRHPDRLVFDLDPGPPAGVVECLTVALELRARLAEDGLEGYVKTSGKKGIQLLCPISGTQPDELVSAYAKHLAEEMAHRLPALVVTQMARKLRPGKVFIDWSQNNAAKTTVAPYSLRAQPSPTVSTPLTWDEVEAGQPVSVGPEEVLERLRRGEDPLHRLLEPGPRLPEL